MAKFTDAVERVLQREGGLVDHPADRGGLTKFGISQRSYPDLDIASLTEEQAMEIYRRDFWDDAYDKIPLQQIANRLFDGAVNMGTVAAIRLLQESLCEIRFGVAVDGRFGPQTMQAVKLACQNGPHVTALFQAWRARHARHYIDLVLEDRTQLVFLDGWIRRAVA